MDATSEPMNNPSGPASESASRANLRAFSGDGPQCGRQR